MGAPPLKCYFLKLTPELVDHFEALAERQATDLTLCNEHGIPGSTSHSAAGAAAAINESLALRHSPDGSFQLMVGDTKVALTNLPERSGHVEIYQKSNANDLHAVGQVQAKLIAQQQVTSHSRERYAAASAAAGAMQRARHTNAFTIEDEAAVLNQAKPRKRRSGPAGISKTLPSEASGTNLQPPPEHDKETSKRQLAITTKSPAGAAKNIAPKKHKTPHAARPLMPWEAQPEKCVVLAQTMRSDASANACPEPCDLLETCDPPSLLDATPRDVARYLSNFLVGSSSDNGFDKTGENVSGGGVRVSDVWAFLPRSTVENDPSNGKNVITITFALLVRLQSPEVTAAVLAALEKHQREGGILNSPEFAIRGQPRPIPRVQLHRYDTTSTALVFLSQPLPAQQQHVALSGPYSDPLDLAAAAGVLVTSTRTARSVLRGVLAALKAANLNGGQDGDNSNDAFHRSMSARSFETLCQLIVTAPLFGGKSEQNHRASTDALEQRKDGKEAAWAVDILENARHRLLLAAAVTCPKDPAGAEAGRLPVLATGANGSHGGSFSPKPPSTEDIYAALRLIGGAQMAWAKREAAERALRAHGTVLEH